MANTNKHWNQFFIGFGVVTVISGIYLIFQEDYISGICGSSVGFFLIYMQKMNKAKEEM